MKALAMSKVPACRKTAQQAEEREGSILPVLPAFTILSLFATGELVGEGWNRQCFIYIPR